MVEYSWEILSLYAAPSVDNLTNVVKRVTWRYQARDGSYVGEIFRDMYLDSADPDNFIQYDSLTKDTIVSWIESSVDMDEVRSSVLEKLELSKNPIVVEKNLPWVYEHRYDRMDKYVLVHNDEVVYGPVHWHSDLMNNNLERLGLEPSLPVDILARKQGVVPIDQPTVINETTKIFKANMQNEQPEESLFTDNGHIIWDFSTGVAVGTYVAVDKSINEVKLNLKNVVNSNREQKEIEGTTVEVNGSNFKVLTGPLSRLLMVEKLNLMEDNELCRWKFMENQWAEISKNNVAFILNTVDNYVQNLLNQEFVINQQIDAAETVDQLKTIQLEIN